MLHLHCAVYYNSSYLLPFFLPACLVSNLPGSQFVWKAACLKGSLSRNLSESQSVWKETYLEVSRSGKQPFLKAACL
jgi:hypothetical protein